ncbi:MAG: GspH/FimT family pseudopilin [Burkholderiaceae bacterium]|nr:GspH/FimT family pseudopilin [Burkholderiaceae bacterium]
MPISLSRSTPRPAASRQLRSACAHGFTLIEVLVVMTISAILLAIGVPMFNSSIASMRASEGANSLVASLELARIEAIRRGTTVSLCRVTSTDPTACDGAAAGGFAAGDWAAGWMVFADVGGSVVGTFQNGTDERIQIQVPVAVGTATRTQILNTAGAVDVITFRPDGLRVTAGAQLNFRVAYPQAAQGTALSCRSVVVDVSGRTATSRITC